VRKLFAGEPLIYVSAISLLEIARKEAKGELVFGMALSKWFQLAHPSSNRRPHKRRRFFDS
jgi:PIN domain nuclease of toxin-antitoxin system